MPLSSAFTGCTRAYFNVHLSARTCLDGRPHDGSPCLITDESRAAEARELLAAPPVDASAGVQPAPDGTFVLPATTTGGPA